MTPSLFGGLRPLISTFRPPLSIHALEASNHNGAPESGNALFTSNESSGADETLRLSWRNRTETPRSYLWAARDARKRSFG
jgi:hypothetical protein